MSWTTDYSTLQIDKANHRKLKTVPEIKWHHFSYWIPERLQWLHFREGRLVNNRENINTKLTKQMIHDATIDVHNEVEIELVESEQNDNFIGKGFIRPVSQLGTVVSVTQYSKTFLVVNPIKTPKNILNAFRQSQKMKQICQ